MKFRMIPFLTSSRSIRIRAFRKPPTHEDRKGRTRQIWAFIIFSQFTTLAALIVWNRWGTSPDSKIFDSPKFTPFTIVAREDVSSTSFILTLRPEKFIRNPKADGEDPYAKEWDTETWSVEFKQPQLQIARSYTPLPPSEDTQMGDLRFYIRKERGGEVSNYLAGLPVGGQIHLRGPHKGYELEGHITDVVFLAGGTGIAPALQVIYTLLERRNNADLPRIRILWANRRREDCLGGTTGELAQQQPEIEDNIGKLVNELETLRQKHPEKLKVDYLVDEEGTSLDQKRLSSLTRNDSQLKYGAVTTRIDSKLLFVSGPEGFVNFLAGSKRWENGKEMQGELGGLIGRLGLRDWKVWKL